MVWIDEFLSQDDGSCNGSIGMSMKWEGSITDNGSKVFVMDGFDNVSASSFDLKWVSRSIWWRKRKKIHVETF